MGKSTRKIDNRSPKARRATLRGLVFKNGWYVLPSRGGVVSSELIRKIEDELDRDDARRAVRPPDKE